MNVTEQIFALALASNLDQLQHFSYAFSKIRTWGKADFSNIYLIPCRDGVGQDYWNCACLLTSYSSPGEIIERLKELETASGRIRPSHHISLDVDLIAWGPDLEQMQFNEKKLPLALDVKIPLYDLWQHEQLRYDTTKSYPIILEWSSIS